jgi:hypothetical protein
MHLIGFLLGVFFAYRASGGMARLTGRVFGLYALAELVYMTYHLDWMVFLFAHTISEVLDLVAIVPLFVAATQGVRLRQSDRQLVPVPAAS